MSATRMKSGPIDSTPLIPADAGIQFFGLKRWVPASAGTSGRKLVATGAPPRS